MTNRLRMIDETTRPDHPCLASDDRCYYHGEYSPAAGIGTPTNDLVLDLKKRPERRVAPDWIYKIWAIEECARILRMRIDPDLLQDATLVPIPPSKTADHPDYDDRVAQVVGKICDGTAVEWRRLLIATVSRDPRRDGRARDSPLDLRSMLAVNPECAGPKPTKVILFDDILTTGATFKACKELLVEAFPGAEVVGCFVARRVRHRQQTSANGRELQGTAWLSAQDS
jgi:hypothetical protein